MFFVAIAVFSGLSYVMVVFALGYQYDFTARTFVRMGSFRIVANTGATVYLNGKQTGTTSFLGNSYSKGYLLPRKYPVRVEKTGYHTWQKNVPVVAGLFTDFPKVVLIPDKLSEEIVASPSAVLLASLASASRGVIRPAKHKVLEFDNHNVWVTWLDDTDYQPFHKAGERELILQVPEKITEVAWYKDHDHVFIAAGNLLSFAEIDTRGGVNLFHLLPLSGPFWYDENENRMFIASPTGVLSVPF